MDMRLLGRVELAFFGVVYALITVSGASVLLHPPRSYGYVADVLTIGWGVLQLLAVVGVVSVIARKPLWEWRAIAPVACGILLYAVVSYMAVGAEGFGHLPRATDITALAVALGARFFALWRKVEQAKIQARAQSGAGEGDV